MLLWCPRFENPAAQPERTFRFVDLSELLIRVPKPTRIVTTPKGVSLRFEFPVHSSDCRDVSVNRFLPHSQGEKDVRSHMLSMSCVRRDLRVNPRRTQAQRRVSWIVVTMNQIMKQARMGAMIYPGLFHQTSRAHVCRNVPTGVCGAKDCEPVESGAIYIFRIVCMQLGHSSLIADITLLFAAFSVEDLDRVEILLLTISLCFSSAFCGGWCEVVQCCARGLQILLHPDGMVEGHCFAPVSHGETRVGDLGSLKSSRSVLILKVMKQRQTLEEVSLGRWRTRVGKVNLTIAAAGGCLWTT